MGDQAGGINWQKPAGCIGRMLTGSRGPSGHQDQFPYSDSWLNTVQRRRTWLQPWLATYWPKLEGFASINAKQLSEMTIKAKANCDQEAKQNTDRRLQNNRQTNKQSNPDLLTTALKRENRSHQGAKTGTLRNQGSQWAGLLQVTKAGFGSVCVI